jgi:hypothetical protein
MVSNSSVTGSVLSTDLSKGGQLGGLVGFNYRGTIINCQASVTVSGTHRLGGLVGNNWGVIRHSRVTASNITGQFLVGGLAGLNYTDGTVSSVVNAVIETSSADAIVTGSAADSLAGGFVGENAGGALKNNYATGSVTGNKYVGGLTGRSGDFLAFPGSIENSYAANSVAGISSTGGLVGEKLSGQVVNSYYDSVTTGKTDTNRGTPKTTAEMQQTSTFSGWDFTNIWMIQPNQYPHLK